MAHWIVEDRGFAGCWYTCSECGEVHNDLYDIEMSSYDCCPDCGAAIDEENEYVEEKSENKTKAPEPHPGLKELNCWSVGGNKLHLDEGCELSLYYEDEQGNTSDDVFIKLAPYRIEGLIGVLKEYLEKPEEKTTVLVAYMYADREGRIGNGDYLFKLDGRKDRLSVEDAISIKNGIMEERNAEQVVIMNVLFLED